MTYKQVTMTKAAAAEIGRSLQIQKNLSKSDVDETGVLQCNLYIIIIMLIHTLIMLHIKHYCVGLKSMDYVYTPGP